MAALLISFLLIILSSSAVFSQVRVTEASPEAPAQTGYPVMASIAQSIVAAKVEIVYRSGGTGSFRAVSMAVEPDHRYRGMIPSSDVVPPGLEFYVQLTTGDGKTYTDPAQAPGANVFSVIVSPMAAQGKAVSLIYDVMAASGTVSYTLDRSLLPEWESDQQSGQRRSMVSSSDDYRRAGQSCLLSDVGKPNDRFLSQCRNEPERDAHQKAGCRLQSWLCEKRTT